MKTWTNPRRLTLSAALLALMAFIAPASAQEPTIAPMSDRVLLRQAQGEYMLDDGRPLTVHVGVRHLGISIGNHPLETWRAENAELLVSPDGMRRLRLYRNTDGSVDRLALETDRLR